jgi:hypothetical protein
LPYLGIFPLGLAVLVDAAPASLRVCHEAICSLWSGCSCLLTCIKNTGNVIGCLASPRFCVAAYEIFFNAEAYACTEKAQKNALLGCCRVILLLSNFFKNFRFIAPRSGVVDSDIDSGSLFTPCFLLNDICAFFVGTLLFQNFSDIYASHVLILRRHFKASLRKKLNLLLRLSVAYFHSFLATPKRR